jgi:hypothetical protein
VVDSNGLRNRQDRARLSELGTVERVASSGESVGDLRVQRFGQRRCKNPQPLGQVVLSLNSEVRRSAVNNV